MTHSANTDLLEALRLSPDNSALRGLLLRGCIEHADTDTLLAVAELCGADAFSGNAGAPALRVLLDAGLDADVVRIAPDTAHAQLAQARIALREGRRDEARGLHRAALERNPALDDPALSAELSGKVVSFAGARERIASIANDRTDDDDVRIARQPAATRVTFADVGGLDTVKQQVRRRIITPFLKPSLFERFKRKAGGGILLYGPPGCGKTLLARATAGECGATFHNVAITDVLDMYIGESERKLHAIFEEARRTAPAVIFFDEIEAIGGKRQHSREATSTKLVSQFLTELDGFAQQNSGVLVLGATNVPWAVDAAFRRPGRFDRVLFVPPPDEAARGEILRLQLEGRPGAQAIDTTSIARATSGFSGADLRNLIDSAADEAIHASIEQDTEVPLSMAHLKAALDDVRPTTLEWLTTARNHARYANQGGQYDEVLAFLDAHGTR